MTRGRVTFTAANTIESHHGTSPTTTRIPLRDIAACLFDRALREITGDPDQPGRLVTAPLVVRASA